jgi:hypothetical protein
LVASAAPPAAGVPRLQSARTGSQGLALATRGLVWADFCG